MAGGAALEKLLEMAGIVSPCVSVSGYPTVRYSFRVSCLLRARGLPSLLFVITAIWLVRFGRSTMRRRVDVDLRNGRLLNRRGNCHGAFALVPRVATVRDFGNQKRKVLRYRKATQRMEVL